MENTYANGIWGNDPHEKAPDFVVGSLSIHADTFRAWLAEQETSEKGYVKIDILERKDGEGWSFKLNTFKKQERSDGYVDGSNQMNDENIPF